MPPTPTSSLLLKKTILITGASRGIGLSIAHRFAAASARRLILVSRDEEALRNVVGDLRMRFPDREEGNREEGFLYKAGDLENIETWRELSREVPTPDILVNAAGMSRPSLLVRQVPEAIDHLLRLNLTSTIWGCQTISRMMMKQRRRPGNTACIINVSSLLALKGGRGDSVYAASKAGVLGLTRSLALELGKANIRVNAIVPGYIETSMTEGMSPAARSEVINTIPLGRFGFPREVADAALFLATNEYANNCVLNLDGGLSAT
ncbi:MAG: hypothetical protein M1834_004224 [Cirrosporium novae-zelandiae]|nr:MAG: hypothetical protein M1834_004224 [Cirrosporium novae-zelandiae]